VSADSRTAQRFPIKASLRYRVPGEADWVAGVTENISASGVFFRGERLAERGTRMEIELVLVADASKEIGILVVSDAEIVRADLSSGTGRLPGLAAKVLDYRLRRWEGATQLGHRMA
jgi:hypothetical protein